MALISAVGVLPHGQPRPKTFKEDWVTNMVQDIKGMSYDSLAIMKQTSTDKTIRSAVTAELAVRTIELGWQRPSRPSVDDTQDFEPDFSHDFDDDFMPYGQDDD